MNHRLFLTTVAGMVIIVSCKSRTGAAIGHQSTREEEASVEVVVGGNVRHPWHGEPVHGATVADYVKLAGGPYYENTGAGKDWTKLENFVYDVIVADPSSSKQKIRRGDGKDAGVDKVPTGEITIELIAKSFWGS
jgi:hypothetical protein